MQIQSQDLFAVIKLAYETLPERYYPSIFNQFYELFPQGFLVAKRYHKIIGFIAGLKTSDTTVRLLMLSVNEHYRKQGVGSNLLSDFITELKKQNIKQIDLEVRTSNTPAIQCYKKHNFTIVETILKFYQNGEDAFIMRLLL